MMKTHALAPAAALFTVLVGVATGMADLVQIADQTQQRCEWRASTFTPAAQHQAALAVDPAGRLLTVWSSRRQAQGRASVYAQRFDAQGVAIGTETALALWPQGHQTDPVVAFDTAGNAWVAWQSFGQDGQSGAIIARRFDAALAGGSELAVNQQTRGDQTQPVLAVSPDGRVLFVWTSLAAARAPTRICGRMFGSNGQPLTDEFAIGTLEKRTERAPAVAAGRDGTFAVVFSVFDDQLDPAGIRLQRFDAAGRRLGDELAVSDVPKQGQIEPVIAATRDGYLVAWLDTESDGDEYGVVARRFDQGARPLGAAFVVNTTSRGSQNAAALAAAPDGRFAVAWNSDDGDQTGVFAQMFAADGARVGSEFRLSSHTLGKQTLQAAVSTQRLAFGRRGELLCVWSGDANQGDETSVNVTLLSPEPLDLAGQAQGVTDRMRPAAGVVALAGGPEPHRPPVFDPAMIAPDEREVRLDGGRFGFLAVNNTGWTPPDPHMAVGPNQIVVMTNGAIAFYEKDGTQTFQQAIEGSSGFWGSVGATDFIFDPEVLYDELSGRFFAMAAEAYAPPGSSKSYVLVAVSDDSNPNGSWYKYRFDTTTLAGNLFDSPNIAVDANAMYITGDGFGNGANYPVYTFDKPSLLAGLPSAIQRSTTLATSTQSAGIPPVTYGNPPALYMIEHAEGTSRTTVRLIALRNPLTTPTFTTHTLTVPSYSNPGDPVQKGTTIKPETFDARFWSVAYRDGYLWATHHINANPVQVRWYQIAMNGWPTSGPTPTLVQSGNISPGIGIHTYFSAITVNANGDAAITCARSSANEYISMNTAWRRPTDPLGTFQPVVIEQQNNGPYSDSNSRWGDYSSIQPDPSVGNTFWAHHEYAVGNSWRTWVAKVEVPWIVGDLNCDSLVNFDDINPFVTALSDPPGYTAAYPNCNILNGDCDADGDVDFDDINPFVALLSGQ